MWNWFQYSLYCSGIVFTALVPWLLCSDIVPIQATSLLLSVLALPRQVPLWYCNSINRKKVTHQWWKESQGWSKQASLYPTKTGCPSIRCERMVKDMVQSWSMYLTLRSTGQYLLSDFSYHKLWKLSPRLWLVISQGCLSFRLATIEVESYFPVNNARSNR